MSQVILLTGATSGTGNPTAQHLPAAVRTPPGGRLIDISSLPPRL